MRVIDTVPRAVHTHVVAHEKGTLGEAFYRVLRDVLARVAVYDTLGKGCLIDRTIPIHTRTLGSP